MRKMHIRKVCVNEDERCVLLAKRIKVSKEEKRKSSEQKSDAKYWEVKDKSVILAKILRELPEILYS